MWEIAKFLAESPGSKVEEQPLSSTGGGASEGAEPQKRNQKGSPQVSSQSKVFQEAEIVYADHLKHMQDAYGVEEGLTLFRDVVESYRKYQSDARPLVKQLADDVAAKGRWVVSAQEMGSMKRILVEMYESLNGLNWSRSYGWDMKDRKRSLDQWYGISTDTQGRVTKVNLVGIGLDGDATEVFERFGAMQWVGDSMVLQELDLSSNRISGTLKGIHYLRSMKVFSVGFNGLTGPVPPDFAQCLDLEALQLHDNSLTGCIPPQLSACRSLRCLYLYSNDLTGPLPPELAELQMLKELRVWDNQLTGPIPPVYGRLENLEVFHAAQNQLTGPLPSEIAGMKSLRYLYLNDNRLSGSIPVEAIANAGGLKSLSLGNNFFENLQGADNLFQSMLPNLEKDLYGEGLLYYGTEYPDGEKGSVRG